MTRVLVVDDHPIVLHACRRMLQDSGISDVIEARDVDNGFRLYHGHHPDIVIVDLGLQDKGLGGLELIHRIRTHDPHVRILVFSMHSDPAIVARALQAGATGYVVKDTSPENFMQAFENVRAGKPYLSGELAMQVALANTPARQNPLADLTPRELQTLSLLAEGKPYSCIAEQLNVSYKTVVNLSAQLKQKLDARNLPELIRTAVQLVSTST
jgi:two-component system, NarL family, invasion response regulator UvrY